MKTTQRLLMAIVATGTLSLSIPSQAAILYNQNVTPNVIFGTGNGNGFFAVDRNNGVELGLRAKIPYTGIYNSDGLGNYTFGAGTIWNLEWSVNTDYLGTSNVKLDDLTYGLFVNGLPLGGIDPINVSWADHGIGNNLTANGAGDDDVYPINTRTLLSYADLIKNNNVAQNSWNASLFTINPATVGSYTWRLEAYDVNGTVAATEMVVNITAVPEPSTYLAGALLLLPFGVNTLRKFRNNRQA